MGAAMAANLVAAGHRVTAYVRRPDQMDKLATLGLDPRTEFADLYDCAVVISMVPTTPPLARSRSDETTPASRVSHRD